MSQMERLKQQVAMGSRSSDELATLQKEVRTKTNELANLNSKVQTLKKESSELKARLEALDKEKSAMITEINQLKEWKRKAEVGTIRVTCQCIHHLSWTHASLSSLLSGEPKEGKRRIRVADFSPQTRACRHQECSQAETRRNG